MFNRYAKIKSLMEYRMAIFEKFKFVNAPPTKNATNENVEIKNLCLNIRGANVDIIKTKLKPPI